MIKHEFKIKEIHNKNKTRVRKRITISFEEEGYELLAVFISSELKNFYEMILPKIESVCSGESESEELYGNRCSLKVGAEKAFIEDDNDEDVLPSVEIATKDLLELIKEWKDKKDVLKNGNNQL